MLGREVVYWKFTNCSCNNVAKGICLLDKKPFLFIQVNFIQVRAFDSYILLNYQLIDSKSDQSNKRVRPNTACGL